MTALREATRGSNPNTAPLSGEWERLEPAYEEAISPRAALGLIALSTDRATVADFQHFIEPCEGVAVFTTRLPFGDVATAETLARMEPHLASAASLLIPGYPLGSISFSCTSGTVAIGPDRVRSAIRQARPETPVATPMEGAVAGFRELGCRRVSLLAPYLVPTGNLVAGFFEDHGIEIASRATFGLDGDRDMNRLSADCLVEAGRHIFDPVSDALFISCTGLRTAPVIGRLEAIIGKPVLTSNQVLAWQALRLAGVDDLLADRGRLFMSRSRP